MEDFKEDHNTRVLLMSLKAGGVALNLTVANYIYLMDVRFCNLVHGSEIDLH